jgi:hypothetical protein
MRPEPRPAAGERLTLFFPLPYGDGIIGETLARLHAALAATQPYELLLKYHPLNHRPTIAAALASLPGCAWREVTGNPAQWYGQAQVTVGCGTSVTLLEAVACGAPVVRLAPSSWFFLDPLHWLDYPVPVATTAAEIRQAVSAAVRLSAADLAELADRLHAYFTPPTPENRQVFLPA